MLLRSRRHWFFRGGATLPWWLKLKSCLGQNWKKDLDKWLTILSQVKKKSDKAHLKWTYLDPKLLLFFIYIYGVYML